MKEDTYYVWRNPLFARETKGNPSTGLIFAETLLLSYLVLLRWLNTVLAVCEYILFAKSWQEKGCSSQAETWQVKNTLMKGFD